ncbi:uncharacterized protein LOC143174916 isoform X2 [Nomia melanderi]|uniref:uncharacterized protein LOC143174916 isoform X2 n=1 Tax=Nomia melanderi TaxID=2448451 RepID=UPI003FCD733C
MNEILQKMSNKRKQKAQQHIPTPKIARNNSSLSQRNTKETSASKDKSNKNLSMEEIFNNLKKQNDELRIQNEAQQIQINELLSKLSTFEECGPSKPDSNKDPKIYNQENPTATISPKNSSLPQDTPNSKDTSQKQKSEAPTSQPSSTLTQQKEDQWLGYRQSSFYLRRGRTYPVTTVPPVKSECAAQNVFYKYLYYHIQCLVQTDKLHHQSSAKHRIIKNTQD